MKEQLGDIEHKLKKVRKRTKEDEKKFAEQHEVVVGVEERCRNMTMIVKYKQGEAKKGIKQDVTQDDIQDLDD